MKTRRAAAEPPWPLGRLSSLSSCRTPESGGSKSTEVLDQNPKLLLLEVEGKGVTYTAFSGVGGQEVGLMESGFGARGTPRCSWSPSLL